MKITCIAIDDEPLALDKMREYIGKVDYLKLLKTFDSGVDALNFLKNNPVDLMFLDIQMDNLTGIQLLESITIKPKVILTTAYDSYALKAYELDVSDYLLKPISFQRFLKAVDKISNKLNIDTNILTEKIDNKKQFEADFIFVKEDYKIEKVNFDDILFVKGMKDYLQIHTNDKKIMTLQNFDTLLQHLPSDNFIRIHKSYVVSINKISSVKRKKITIGGEKIPIGETYREYFYQLLKSKNLIV